MGNLVKSLWLVGVWILITFAGWIMAAAGLNRALFSESPWNFAFHALFLLVPLLWLALDPRRARSYGIHIGAWRRDLGTGVALLGVLIIPALLSDLLSGNLRLTPAAAQSGVVSAMIFLLLFVGVGEELLYRGFFQGELNRIWGRPYRLRGTSFGMGLILASGLFGLGHLLNPFNPLQARFGLDWLFLFVSSFVAVLFGLVRERMDGLITVCLAHLGLVFYVRVFVVTPFSGTALIVTWIIGTVILTRRVMEKREGETGGTA